MNYISKSIVSVFILFPNLVSAGFDFGGEGGGCEGGNGTFQQQIDYWNGDPEKAITVGTIPKDLKDIYISLKSDEDVDIRLYDANGKKIVHWPNGILFDYDKASTSYNGVTIEYSGYAGDGTGSGHEYIKISGTTQNDFIMKAFGYKAGYAKVDYSWAGKVNCSEGSTPSASGSGDFQQQIVQKDIVKVGDIPPKVNNLYITLKSDEDVDIQLYDKDDGTKIIVWPDGILNDYNKQTTNYKGMQIEWSGYGGDGTGSGHEYIKITGETTCNLIMKAYGYQAGYAEVHYEWGDETTPPTTKLKGLKFVSATPASGEDYAIVDETITFKATTYSSENGKVKLFIQFYDGTNYGTEHAMHKSSSTLWFYNRELHSAGKEKKYKIIAKDLDGKVIKEAKGSIEVKEKTSFIDLAYKGTYKVTQGNNGSRSHYNHGTWDNTYAIDFAMPLNTTIISPVDGEIYKVYDETHGGCLEGGRVMVIKDNKGNYLTFLHLRSFIKTKGSVHKGEEIAKSGGSKGNKGTCINHGYGYHLHFHLWSGYKSPDSHTIPFTSETKIRVKVDGQVKYLYGNSLNDSNILGKQFTSLQN